jgi:hypothetical protein
VSLSSLEGGTSTRGFTLASVGGEESSRGEVSSNLMRLVAVPKMEEVREESSVQPLAHLASATVRTFELVYSAGKIEVLLSAKNLDDIREYSELLSLVYGGMKFEDVGPSPAFLRELPAIVSLGY